jgi:hypothetical protein
MASDFARRRFDWLDQIVADREITAAGFQLAYVISAHINRATGEAFPSQETLADKINITVRGVRNLTDQLAERGHLQVAESRGRGHSIRYRMVVKKQQAQQKELFPESTAPVSGIEAPAPIGESPQSPATRRARGVKNLTEDAALAGAFEEWWAQYPKKVEKGAAKKAWHKVVKDKRATIADLLAGVMRYAASRTGEEPKYTKGPAGWLNTERWTDEVTPASPERRTQFGGPPQRESWSDVAYNMEPTDE